MSVRKPARVQYFLQQYKVKHGRPELKMLQNLMPYFLQYGCPGNVRELESAVARMIILSNGPTLMLEDVPEFLQAQQKPPAVEPAAGPVSLADVEKQLVLDALQRCNGNQTRAAQYLNMSRRAFSYRLQRYTVRPAGVKSMKRALDAGDILRHGIGDARRAIAVYKCTQGVCLYT